MTGVLIVALLASRRTPLRRGWDAVHRVVRPAVSALVAVLLVAVAAGCAAAAYAAIGDDHPRRIAGAALLGAPNGVWLGMTIGLCVPWHGEATGVLTRFLPDPLDDLLVDSDQPVTPGRLAERDGRVWLPAVAAALGMLLAGGVVQAARTPVDTPSGGRPRRPGAVGFAGRCALRLGVATALALPLLGLLTGVSLYASLPVLGIDAFGTGLELRAHLGTALLLGAVWGAGSGAGGALLAWASGAAERRVAAPAREEVTRGRADFGREPGPYLPGPSCRPPDPATNPYLRLPQRWGDRETEVLRAGGDGPGERVPGEEGPAGDAPEDRRPTGPPHPAPEDRRPDVAAPGTPAGLPYGDQPFSGRDPHGAPTVAHPVEPPARSPRRLPGPRPAGPPSGAEARLRPLGHLRHHRHLRRLLRRLLLPQRRRPAGTSRASAAGAVPGG